MKKHQSIILNNKTHYSSRDLKKLFGNLLKKYKKAHSDFFHKSVRITCIYNRYKDGFCGGYAYYNNNIVILKLPKEKIGYTHHNGLSDTFEQRLTRTFEHELDHCRGLKHRVMEKDSARDISHLDMSIVIGEKTKNKKNNNKSTDKLISLINRRKNWETKAKRAATALKKLNMSIKYYQKKIAADSKNLEI